MRNKILSEQGWQTSSTQNEFLIFLALLKIKISLLM